MIIKTKHEGSAVFNAIIFDGYTTKGLENFIIKHTYARSFEIKSVFRAGKLNHVIAEVDFSKSIQSKLIKPMSVVYTDGCCLDTIPWDRFYNDWKIINDANHIGDSTIELNQGESVRILKLQKTVKQLEDRIRELERKTTPTVEYDEPKFNVLELELIFKTKTDS
jgi:predicted ribosome quality control (RQC) complex YloA/Tae2 family protein